ncbi:hypothetical protein L9F63_022016, partial [Diploptera punctata]
TQSNQEMSISIQIAAYQALYRIICYYGSWAVYRPGDGKYDVENIDPTLCTHIVYGFVGVSGEGQVTILDSWNEIDKAVSQCALKRFNDLKQKNPSLKVMAAAGGWNAGSYSFSTVVSSDSLIDKLVQSVLSFLETYGYDGFDLDWEYPTLRGGAAGDKSNFIKLLQKLQAAFQPKGYILSAAVSAGEATIDPAYDIPSMNQYLNFINVMTYDLHGSWDPVTGENAPLYAGPTDTTDSAKTLNVDTAIQYWISKGASKEKINLGMGTYGRSFTLQSASSSDVGAAITGPGTAGPYTREAGTLGFNEICEQKSQWTEHWNDAQQVPYATNGNQWVGYDNVRSITIKCDYIKSQGLGGGMIWSLETDDFLGKCGQGNNPLLTAIHSSLIGGGSEIYSRDPDFVTPTDPDQSTDPTNPSDTTTSSSTTTSTTTQSSVPPSGVCTTTGYVRDPSNCQVFYYCEVENGAYKATSFSCPPGTAFDTTILGCNYTDQVQC